MEEDSLGLWCHSNLTQLRPLRYLTLLNNSRFHRWLFLKWWSIVSLRTDLLSRSSRRSLWGNGNDARRIWRWWLWGKGSRCFCNAINGHYSQCGECWSCIPAENDHRNASEGWLQGRGSCRVVSLSSWIWMLAILCWCQDIEVFRIT